MVRVSDTGLGWIGIRTSCGVMDELGIARKRWPKMREAELRAAVDPRLNIKAVVLRVDSPGGDALASDLMWREIQVLSKDKPVIASMSDTAASGLTHVNCEYAS